MFIRYSIFIIIYNAIQCHILQKKYYNVTYYQIQYQVMIQYHII